LGRVAVGLRVARIMDLLASILDRVEEVMGKFEAVR
jgi:hypothetical protein